MAWEDHEDLKDTSAKKSAPGDKPIRVRRPVAEDTESEATTTVVVDALSGVQPGALPWEGPYRAVGVKVVDHQGRVVCICSSHAPMDTRQRGAKVIAAAMNSHK